MELLLLQAMPVLLMPVAHPNSDSFSHVSGNEQNAAQQLDLSSADLSKLRVKQLKNIIAGWGEKCRGCSSKQDYIDLINAKRHLHSNKVDL